MPRDDGASAQARGEELTPENQQRLDLDDYEASKQRLREIEAVEAEVAAEKPRHAAAVSGGRGNRGGNREVARRLGVDERDIRRTRQHVETADDYPVFQAPGWKRSKVSTSATTPATRKE